VVERAAGQLLHSSPPSIAQVEKALAFMDRFANKAFLGDEARIMAQMICAELHLLAGRKETAWELITQVGPQVKALEGTGAESVVKGSFYRAEATYYKVAGPAGNFYRSTIQYLAHTPPSTLTAEKRLEIAVDVSLAALVATDVYNFGEVLAQHIVSELETAPAQRWVRDLLVVFNNGDVAGFNQLVNTHRAAFEGTVVLAANMPLLKQKVALLCLMKVVFDRPPHERVIAFADIAAACKLDVDQVEWLVMRAFSQELLRGTIDQVDGVVNISWLLPRVLDLQQTAVLDGKLVAWKAKVQEAIQVQAPLADMF